MKFYLNEETKEVRVAEEFDNDTTVIVKIFPNSKIKTLKIWKGSLSEIEKSWKTKPWNVAGNLATSYADQFWSAVHELSYELGEIDYNHQLDIEEELIDEYK